MGVPNYLLSGMILQVWAVVLLLVLGDSSNTPTPQALADERSRRRAARTASPVTRHLLDANMFSRWWQLKYFFKFHP